jgi:hypothetical protein
MRCFRTGRAPSYRLLLRADRKAKEVAISGTMMKSVLSK